MLAYFLERGQISEVFIHNMKLQSEERTEKLEAEQHAERKPLGFVAVAAGKGNAKILESLGVDVVVSGGQTMNPSTKDLLDAAAKVNADAIIFLPNNKNIIMAAQSACEPVRHPGGRRAYQVRAAGLAAMFGVDAQASLEDNVEAMTEAFADVKTGEVTTAIKDSKDAEGNAIADGDVIGIADGAIHAVGHSVSDVVMGLLEHMEADDCDTCTLLAGEDLSDEDFQALQERIEQAYEDLRSTRTAAISPCTPSSSPWSRAATWPIGSQQH